MHIEITLKREASPNVVLNNLYRNSQMQITYGIIMLAIVNGEPKILNLKDILRNYIDFQVDVITRRTIFDLRKAEERAHILEGLKIAIDFIDEVIRIIRSSKDQPSARQALSERFGLDDAQTQAIVSMRLGQLSGLEREKIEEELAVLLNKIADYKDILSNGERLLGIIKTELNAIKHKFNDERRTQIESVSGEVDIEDLIPYDDCVITMTNFGYVKRQKVDNYRIQRRGGRGISGMNRRSEDVATDMFVSGTHDYVLFFSNLGRVYRMKCYMIPEGSRTSKGMNINNLLPLAPNEKVTSMIRMPEEGDEGMYLVMITKKGIIKRTAAKDFHSIRKGGLNAINLDEGDELAWVRLTNGNSQLLIATENGMALRIEETIIRTMSRIARGVKAISLKNGDKVIGMSILRPGSYILTVSENGYGRLSPQSDYTIRSNRGGIGLINYNTKRYGKVAAIKAVDLDDDIIIIADNGLIIRIYASSISISSRISRGVKLMKLDDNSKVATLSRAPHEEEEPEDEENRQDEQFFTETSIESQTIIE